MAGRVEKDMVIDVPIVRVPLTVRVVDDEGKEKDVASCRSVNQATTESDSGVRTNDAAFNVAACDVHSAAVCVE